jgi:hypothetical protein
MNDVSFDGEELSRKPVTFKYPKVWSIGSECCKKRRKPRMADEDFPEIDEAEEVESDEGHLAAAKKELERRCTAASLELREVDTPPFGKYSEVKLPAGREKRAIRLWDSGSRILTFLSVPFEKYVFLRPYEGICSYSEGIIEALLQSLERLPPKYVERRLLGKGGFEELKEDERIDFTLSADEGTAIVGLSPPSESLKALSSNAERATLSLKISGISIMRHDHAVGLLRRIADSLFFQIDLSLGVAFNLMRERIGPAYIGMRRRTVASINELQFPTQEYDNAPMSLFFYARSAHGMPLLQFLAYYQVIEFYFPIYYKAEAKRKIRRILKDPSFRADRDTDIGRVLSSLTSGRGTSGDERSMIRATIQECVDPHELRGFLTETEERAEFFSSKTKGITSTKIPIADASADLRNHVADRIYEIRCKIVHTKAEAQEREEGRLLPFSKEADLLYDDIALARYLAQRVLITASTPLKIG